MLPIAPPGICRDSTTVPAAGQPDHGTGCDRSSLVLACRAGLPKPATRIGAGIEPALSAVALAPFRSAAVPRREGYPRPTIGGRTGVSRSHPRHSTISNTTVCSTDSPGYTDLETTRSVGRPHWPVQLRSSEARPAARYAESAQPGCGGRGRGCGSLGLDRRQIFFATRLPARRA